MQTTRIVGFGPGSGALAQAFAPRQHGLTDRVRTQQREDL